jgi:hypothetical protein
MTNLNLDLIEKVRQQKAAVQYNPNVDNLNHLQALYKAIYPNVDTIILDRSSYYYTGYNGTGWSGEVCPVNMESIPLSAFFIEPTVTSEDNAKLSTKEQVLISDMNERLKRLEEIYLSYKVGQPIDTTEGEQEQGKEWKPKVGEWVKDKYGRIGLAISQFKFDSPFFIDRQNGKTYEEYEWKLAKPTPEEIQAHLVPIADKKYPVGATFINLYSNVRQIVANHKYTHYKNGELRVNGGLVWHNGKWAELAPIETEQPGERYKPTEVRERYFYISDYGEILSAEWFNDYLDRTRHLICNCFETKEAAQEAAEAIKQYLSTNKF